MKLTVRELEILRLMCDGMKSKDIAQKLFISAKTVETHRYHIGEKSGCKTGPQLGCWAVRQGVV